MVIKGFMSQKCKKAGLGTAQRCVEWCPSIWQWSLVLGKSVCYDREVKGLEEVGGWKKWHTELHLQDGARTSVLQGWFNLRIHH